MNDLYLSTEFTSVKEKLLLYRKAVLKVIQVIQRLKYTIH